ncbi:unnamed protein product [Citrullus colocynthis]|uniref:Peroxisomal membrane protein PEX14 central plants domain-containing protein n=1 Tax=Citrullus colocynthis TaxID=252529 RepID=A0ABP0XW64_9ROSI
MLVNDGHEEIVKGESSISSLVEEAAAAAKAASEAAIDLARASQDMLNSKYQAFDVEAPSEVAIDLARASQDILKGDSERTNYSGETASEPGGSSYSTIQKYRMNHQRNDDDSASWEQPIRRPRIPPPPYH